MSALAVLASLEELDRFLTATVARAELGDHICCAAQPSTVHGSPEVLVDDGVVRGASITGGWADHLVASLDGKGTEFEIRAALQRAANGIDLQPFAQATHELILRGLMLGALDSEWERENDEEVAPAKFADAPRKPDFVYAPFTEAIKQFEERKVLPPAAFQALEAGARRRAFTVAGLARQDLLDATHAELLRQLKTKREGGAVKPGDPPVGANLRDFQKFARESLEKAGWTPQNPSHVETIFRTNGMSAIASGRAVEMSKPAVVAALPYWQIRTVKDARQRPTHGKADGIVLPANHPFWRHAYPPFGYNCRCRVIARTKAWLERNGISVGPVPEKLPDPGFESGTAALISVPPATLQPAPAVQARPPIPQRPPIPLRQPPLPAQAQLPFPSQPVVLPSPFGGPPAAGFRIPPPPMPRPKQVTFDARNITIGGYSKTEAENYEKVQAAAERLFGKPVDAHLVERLSGGNHIPGQRHTIINGNGADELSIHSTFKTADGDSTIISRKFRLGRDGKVEAYHSLFEIPKTLQGRGIAKAVLREQIREYRHLGVERVKLTAAWVGRYTWPRMGFAFAGDDAMLQATRAAFKRHLVKELGKEVAEKVAAHVTTLREIALTEVGGKQLGKTFLADVYPESQMFPMRLNLDPADPNFQLVAHYLGL